MGILAIPLIIFIILMGQYFPAEAPEGFSSFIVAFEFARTPADIQLLFSGLPETVIRNVDVGNYLDYGFMITYTTLLILSFLKFSKELNKKWLKLGAIIAIGVFVADFTENIFLLRITDNFLASAPGDTISSNLTGLHFFTWLKWGGLSVSFALFYPLFFRKKWYVGIAGVVFLLPLLFLLGIPKQSPFWLTIFTNLIFLCFAILIFYLFTYKNQHKKS
jgi:hypothetical protein